MPTTYKILGQVAPAVSTPTSLYVVPAAPVTGAVVSSIIVCNRGVDIAGFRVSVHPGGTGIQPQYYIYYDTPIAENDTFIATIGLTLESADEVQVEGTGVSGGDLSFQLYGSEIS